MASKSALDTLIMTQFWIVSQSAFGAQVKIQPVMASKSALDTLIMTQFGVVS